MDGATIPAVDTKRSWAPTTATEAVVAVEVPPAVAVEMPPAVAVVVLAMAEVAVVATKDVAPGTTTEMPVQDPAQNPMGMLVQDAAFTVAKCLMASSLLTRLDVS
jgi:hypothetical protein